MTAEELLNNELAARYIGKRISGPSWDPEPFVVAKVHWDQDYDYVSIWFWSDRIGYPGTFRSHHVGMDEPLPELI